MGDLLDNYTRPIARCHQREVPVVDAVGRPLFQGAAVVTRHERVAGTVLFLFGFADYKSPEIEIEIPTADGRAIFTFDSRLTGGCWRFDTLLLATEGGDQ